MYTRETQTAALLSGLLPNWGNAFNATGLDIKQTDPSNSDKSTADTVALMGAHAKDASSSSQIKQALSEAGCLQSGLTEDQVIEKVFRYIKGRVRFVEDDSLLSGIFQQPASRELLITPPVLLGMNQPMGDCDDFSMLCCAMLQAKGIRCDFVTVAANSNQPAEFSHVYCMARTRDGRSIPLDCSHGSDPGWETNRAFRKQVWPVFNWNRNRGGNGMVVGGNSFQQGLMGLLGLGDCSYDDEGNLISCDDTQAQATLMTGPSVTPAELATMNTGSSSNGGGIVSTGSSSNVFNSILPGLFASVEKVVQQTTQPAGIQSQTCNAQGVCTTTSTVLPANYTGALNTLIPGTSTSIGSILPLLLIVGVVIFAADKK